MITTQYNDPVLTSVKASSLSRGDYFRIGDSVTVFKTLMTSHGKRNSILVLNLDDLELETYLPETSVRLVEINTIDIKVDICNESL